MLKIYPIIIICICSFVSLFSFGQLTTTEYLKLANDQIMEGNMKAAEKYYEEAINYGIASTSLLLKYGDCLAILSKPRQSNQIYQQILNGPDSATNWGLNLKIAQNLIRYGEYHEALEIINTYTTSERFLNEPVEIKNESSRIRNNFKFAIEHENDSIIFRIEHIENNINTSQSEFNPVLFNDKYLIWSYYRPVYSDTLQLFFEQEYRSEIFHASSYGDIYINKGSFNNKINSKNWFTANINFSKDYRDAYFTRCQNLNGNIGNCQIWHSKYKNGNWTTPEKLPREINLPQTNNTHPCIAEVDDYQILYFSSNRKGGHGNQDIWYSILKNGEFSIPSNIGLPINTKGDELTPFYDPDIKTLFFSSDDHENFGGHDVFKAEGNLNTFSEPENMGLPVNSEFNDLYYIFYDDLGYGFLSSNRSITLNSGTETHCCYDIYQLFSTDKHPEKTKETDSIKVDLTNEEKIKQILPLTLYFDNDQPDPKSILDTTSTNYQTLLIDYIGQKNTYIKEYSSGLKGKNEQHAIDTINNFFDSLVYSGFTDLKLFCSILKNEIDSGKSVIIEVKGFSSPLNNPEYNLALSKRRIASLENYLYSYDGGYFSKYLSNLDSTGPSIKIVKTPFGDTKSSTYVSNNPNDKRNSVYSKSAALERKIQIVIYSSSNNAVKTSRLPSFSLSTDSINIGEMKENQFQSGIIKINNPGNKSITISKLKSDCTCLQLEIKSKTIAPNQSESIYYLIKSDNLTKGRHAAKAKIESAEGYLEEVKFVFEVI